MDRTDLLFRLTTVIDDLCGEGTFLSNAVRGDTEDLDLHEVERWADSIATIIDHADYIQGLVSSLYDDLMDEDDEDDED